MRRTCTICGRIANERTMKKSNKNKKLNVILTASLSLIGSVDRTNVGSMAEEFTSRAKHYCHSHVVEAAQYLSADVLSTGKHFSYYKDPSAGGIVAYFITTDIPPHLVEVINDMCKNSVQITDRDVLSFINAALKKHYGTSMWSRHYAEEERFEETAINTEEADSDSEAFTQIPEVSDCEPSCSDSESVAQSGCKMRRTCVLCGRFANAKTMIRNNRNKKMGLILTASLSLIGCVQKAKVDKVVERISNRIKYFCRSHVVQAARYLTAEVLAAGREFSYYKDPSASGPTAYFNTADIPLHIVNVINGMSKNDIAITARDVFSFINGALKKYYGTRLWLNHNEEEEDLENGTLNNDAGDLGVDCDSEPLPAFEDNTQSDVGMVHGFEGSDDEMSQYESNSSDSEDVSLTGCKMRRTCVFCGRYDSATTMKQTIRNKKLNLILTSSLSLIGCVDRSNVDRVTEHFSNRNKYFCRSHVVEAAQYLCAEVLATGKRFSYYNDPSARGVIAYFNTTDIPSHLVEVINGMGKNAGPITDRDVLSFINTALKKYYGTYLWSRHYKEESSGEAIPDADTGDSVASSNSEALSETEEIQNDVGTAVEGEECDDGASSLTAKMLLSGAYGGDAEDYSLSGRKMRRTCVFCGRISSVKTMKQTLRNKKLTLILLSSLSMIGCVNRADVGNMVEEFSNHVKHFCRSHVVEAAQYLSAEVLATGKRFSFYNDPSARGIIAYFITTDIPSHVVEMISGMSNNTVPITARDVMSFINAALKKYYGTPMWSRHYEEKGNFPKTVTKADTKDSADSSDDESLTKVEKGAHSDVRVAVECDKTGDEVSEKGRSSCDSESSSVMLLEDFGETDPANLQKYFVVQGEALLELFRFCPECGDRLGKTQLKAVGGAAAVTFACQRCAMKPVVRRFENPTRALVHRWKHISEGNVVVPVSAGTTSVQHTKLEPWAEQMNLSMYRIDEVANNHERV